MSKRFIIRSKLFNSRCKICKKTGVKVKKGICVDCLQSFSQLFRRAKYAASAGLIVGGAMGYFLSAGGFKAIIAILIGSIAGLAAGYFIGYFTGIKKIAKGSRFAYS